MDAAAIAGQGIPELLDKGLLGLAVIALSAVVIYLYMDGRTLRTELAALYEKRTTEVAALAKETASGLASSSGTMAAMAEEVSSASRLIQQMLDTVRVMPPGMEGLAKQLEANAARMDRLLDAAARGAAR